MAAQTQFFDDGSTLTTDDGVPIGSTPATGQIATVNGSAGSPSWNSFWQGAAGNLLAVGTDYARSQLGLTTPGAVPTAAPARPADALRPPSQGVSIGTIAIVGLIAYAVFK